MSPTPNPAVVLSRIPSGYPKPGEDIALSTSGSIDLDNTPLNGGVLVKTLWLSLDPYMRGRMRDPSVKSFTEPYLVGQPLNNYGVGRVLRSEVSSLPEGATIMGELPFQAYSVLPPSVAKEARTLENKENLPLSDYLGILGMPGETGWYGLEEFGKCKPGESIYVSTGAGTVGSMVCQLAKRKGMRVIASAGSDSKVDFIRSLGVDRAFNYKTSSVSQELEEFGGVDVYWDNVGGKTLDEVLLRMNVHGRIIVCGMASEYNDEQPYGVKNLIRLIYWRLTLSGFVVADLRPKYVDQFYAQAPGMVARGEIKHQMEVVEGLEHVGEAFLRLMKGKNEGKVVVKVADE